MAGKREVALVASFLEEEADSAEDLAALVIDKLDAARVAKVTADLEKVRYAVVKVNPQGLVTVYGPYPGEQTAENAISGERGVPLVPRSTGDRLAVAPMRSSEYLRGLWERVDAPAEGIKVKDIKGRGRLEMGDTILDTVTEVSILDRLTLEWKKVG